MPAPAHSERDRGLAPRGQRGGRGKPAPHPGGEAVVGEIVGAMIAAVRAQRGVEPVVARCPGSRFGAFGHVGVSVRLPGREPRLELLLGAQDVGLDRADRAVEHVRGFLVRQVIMVALHDRRALALGEHRERALHVEPQRRAARVIAAGFARTGCVGIVVVGDVGIAVAQQLLLALARVGQEGVGRDPVEPGREPGLLAERLEVAVGEHEGLLREVVGERVIAGRQPPQRRPDRRLVAADELGERVPVVLDDDAGDELRIGDRRLRHRGARLTPPPPVPPDGAAGGAVPAPRRRAPAAAPRTTTARRSRCRRTAARGRRCWACGRRASRTA